MDPASTTPTDQQLLRLYATSRDQHAFHTLVSRHIDWIYSAALRLTRNPAHAEDITQGVLLALSQKAASLQNHPALVGWLFRATRFGALALQRSERLRKKYEESAMPTPQLAEEPIWSDLEPRIDSALARLPKNDRHILLLRFYQQLPIPDIAATLHISQDAARKRTDRALERLRSLLGVKSAAALAALLTTSLLLSAPKHLLAAAAIPKTILLTKSIHSFFLLAKLKTAAAVLLLTVIPVALTTTIIIHLHASTRAAAAPTTDPTSLRGIVLNPNGKPAPNIILQLLTTSITTTTGPDGRFNFPSDPKLPRIAQIIARSPDNTLQSYADCYDPVVQSNKNNVAITLQPARIFPITVNDASNVPVAGADVSASGVGSTIAQSTTDPSGKTVLTVPANVPLQSFLAVADNHGLDYKLFWTSDIHDDPYHLAADYTGPIALTLAKPTTVTVKVVDGDNHPIAHAAVFPWYFTLPDHGGEINNSRIGELKKITGPDGITTFSYIPATLEKPITFWVTLPHYAAIDRFMWDSKKSVSTLTATLYKTVILRGHVKDEAGNPVAAATVRAGGASHGFDQDRAEAKSESDGSFSLEVTPEQYYLIAALKDHDASAPLTCMVHKTIPDTPLDLTMHPAVHVYGQLTAGANHQPVPKGEIVLVQTDDSYRKLPIRDQLPDNAAISMAVTPSIDQIALTDQDGKFDFYTFPNEHARLDAYARPQRIYESFSLLNTPEYHAALHASDAPAPFHKLSGRVLLSDNPPIAASHAKIATALIDSELEPMIPPRATTDDSGNFQIRFPRSPFYLFASTPDGSQATILSIKPTDPDNLSILLAPTTTATGRLVDSSGQPIPNTTLMWGMRILNEKRQTSQDVFGSTTITASDGTFTLPHLVPQTEYILMQVEKFSHGLPYSFREITRITPADSTPLNLGDVRHQRPPPQIHPATPPR